MLSFPITVLLSLAFVYYTNAELPWFFKDSPYYNLRSNDSVYLETTQKILSTVFDPSTFYDDVNGTCWCNMRPPFMFTDSIMSREMISDFTDVSMTAASQYFMYTNFETELNKNMPTPENTASYDFLLSYNYLGPLIVETWNCTLCGYPCDLRYNYSMFKNCPYCTNGVLNRCRIPKYYQSTLPANCSNETLGLNGLNVYPWNGEVKLNRSYETVALPFLCKEINGTYTCDTPCQTPVIISDEEGLDGGFMCFQGNQSDYKPRNYIENPVSNPNKMWAKVNVNALSCKQTLVSTSENPQHTVQYYGTTTNIQKSKTQTNMWDILGYVNTFFFTQSSIIPGKPTTITNLEAKYNPYQYFVNVFTLTPVKGKTGSYDVETCSLTQSMVKLATQSDASDMYALCPESQYAEMKSCMLDFKGCPVITDLNATKCTCSISTSDLWCQDDMTIGTLLQNYIKTAPLMPKCPISKNTTKSHIPVQTRGTFFNLDDDLSGFDLTHPYFWINETSNTITKEVKIPPKETLIEIFKDNLNAEAQCMTTTSVFKESLTETDMFTPINPKNEPLALNRSCYFTTTINRGYVISASQNPCCTNSKESSLKTCESSIGSGWHNFCALNPSYSGPFALRENSLKTADSTLFPASGQNVTTIRSVSYEFNVSEGILPIAKSPKIALVKTSSGALVFSRFPYDTDENSTELDCRAANGTCISTLEFSNDLNGVDIVNLNSNVYLKQTIRCCCINNDCTQIVQSQTIIRFADTFFPKLAEQATIIPKDKATQSKISCPGSSMSDWQLCGSTLNTPIQKSFLESIDTKTPATNYINITTQNDIVLHVSTGCSMPDNISTLTTQEAEALCQETHRINVSGKCLQLGNIPCESHLTCPKSTPQCYNKLAAIIDEEVTGGIQLENSCTGKGPMCTRDSDCIGPGNQKCNSGVCLQECYANFQSTMATEELTYAYATAIIEKTIKNPTHELFTDIFVDNNYVCPKQYPNCKTDATGNIGYCSGGCSTDSDCSNNEKCIGLSTSFASTIYSNKKSITSFADCEQATNAPAKQKQNIYAICNETGIHYCETSLYTSSLNSEYVQCKYTAVCPLQKMQHLYACPPAEGVSIKYGQCSRFEGPQYYIANQVPNTPYTYNITFYSGAQCTTPAQECNDGQPYTIKAWSHDSTSADDRPLFINGGRGFQCSSKRWTKVTQNIKLRPPLKKECETYDDAGSNFACKFEEYQCQNTAIKQSTLHGISINAFRDTIPTNIYESIDLFNVTEKTIEFFNMKREPLLLTETIGDNILINQNVLNRLLWMRFYKLVENWNSAYPSYKIHSPTNSKLTFWEFYTNFTRNLKGQYKNNGNDGTCGFILCNAVLPTFRLDKSGTLKINTYSSPSASIQIGDSDAEYISLSDINEASIMYNVIVDTNRGFNGNVYLPEQSGDYDQPIYVNVKTAECSKLCSQNVACDGVPSINDRSDCTTITDTSTCKDTPGCMVCYHGAFTTSGPPTQYNYPQIEFNDGINQLNTYPIKSTSGEHARISVGALSGIILLSIGFSWMYKRYKPRTWTYTKLP